MFLSNTLLDLTLLSCLFNNRMENNVVWLEGGDFSNCIFFFCTVTLAKLTLGKHIG